MDKSPPPPSADPGWNDPPKFTYDPNNATPKVKLNLSKRVAFPMSPSSGSPASRKTELAPSGLPMPHSKNAPPLMLPEQSTSDSSLITAPLLPPPCVPMIRPVAADNTPSDTPLTSATEELSLEDLTKAATRAMEHLIQVGRENSMEEEILSRLDVCLKELEAQKLSTDVLKLLISIHEALLPDEDQEPAHKTQTALKYQQLLMVNHIQQCSLWGPAIKRVISCIAEGQPGEEEDAEKKLPSVAEPSSSASVAYFQPTSVDADAPPVLALSTNTADEPPKVTLYGCVENQITNSEKSKQPESESNSLFQRLKSRILHI